jgi:predicted DNA-binding transcriptional regulator AlpA
MKSLHDEGKDSATSVMDAKDDRLIKASEVARLLDCCVRSVWKWASENKIPKPVHPFKRMSRWRLSEIMAIVLQDKK